MSELSVNIPIANRLLAALPLGEYEHLAINMKPIHLAKGQTLYEAGDTVQYAYFPTGGMVSLLSTTEDGETLEVAMVCNHGMIGVPIILQTGIAPYRMVVQIPTDALRIEAKVLQEEFSRGGKFQEIILRYAETFLIQGAQSALCMCFHSVEQRLCRWLLIAHDCVSANTFAITHEFISHMLGTSRPNITGAAKTLQQAGLIRYTRGRVTILDHAGLESRSCECYRVIRDALDMFLIT